MYRKSHMHHKSKGKGLLSLIIGALILKVIWNAVVPGLGGPFLAFWQAAGIVMLTRLLGWSATCHSSTFQETKDGTTKHQGMCEKGAWRAHFEAKWKEMQSETETPAGKPDIDPVDKPNPRDEQSYKEGFTTGKWEVNIVDVESQAEEEPDNPSQTDSEEPGPKDPPVQD